MVRLDRLDALLADVDRGPAFEFVHSLAEGFGRASASMHVHLADDAVEDRTVVALSTLMDAFVDFADDSVTVRPALTEAEWRFGLRAAKAAPTSAPPPSAKSEPQLIRSPRPSAASMPAFDTLSEVIVYARDLDRLSSFYAGVFGLSVVEGSPDDGFVRFDTGSCNLCLHSGGEDHRGRDAPKVVFAVEDVAAARSYLLDHGVDPEGNAFSVESSPRQS